MSLKLPGVGKKIEKYDYKIDKMGDTTISITITYVDLSGYKRQSKLFEIRSDIRWKDIDIIVKVVDEVLSEGLGERIVRIRIDKDRTFLWIDKYQFTGNEMK